MRFTTFLKQSCDKNFWKHHTVFCFQGSSYPFSFLGLFFKKLVARSVISAKPQWLRYADHESSMLCGRLSQSILGESTWYLLGEVKGRCDKKMQHVLSFLSRYHGPHKVLFFLHDEVKIPEIGAQKLKNMKLIALDNEIDQQLFYKLIDFFDKKHLFHPHSLQAIFSSNPTISLDAACGLLLAFEFIRDRSSPFFTRYIADIIEPQRSLRLLAHYFFMKNSQRFLRAWHDLEPAYSEMFWVAFWSEQLWQAFHVRNLLKQRRYAEARRVGYRLPYSFFKERWQQISQNELIRAHDFVYQIDYSYKRGSTFCSFDYFYLQYFSGTLGR